MTNQAPIPPPTPDLTRWAQSQQTADLPVTDGSAADLPGTEPPAADRPVTGLVRRSAPKRTKESETQADLRLLRQNGTVRSRCIASVLALFLSYTVVIIAIGHANVYLLWIWIPIVLSGVIVGTLLDLAHRGVLEQPPDAAGALGPDVRVSDATTPDIPDINVSDARVSDARVPDAPAPRASGDNPQAEQ